MRNYPAPFSLGLKLFFSVSRTGSRTVVKNYATIFVVTLLLALRFASAATSNIAFGGLILYSLVSPAAALRSLFLTWLFLSINPGLADQGNFAAPARFIIIFSSALSVFGRVLLHRTGTAINQPAKTALAATTGLSVFLIIHSYAFSPLPEVSILKVFAWTLAVTTITLAWGCMSPNNRIAVAREFLFALLLVAVCSLTLVFSGTGFLRNGTGFQGILNHPQVFGPAMGFLFTWSATRLLERKRVTWAGMATVALSAVLMFRSECRSAGIAALFSVVISLGIFTMSSLGARKTFLPSLSSPRIVVAIAGILILGAIRYDLLLKGANYFISKSGRANVTGLVDAFGQSRGGLVDREWSNVETYPWTGIGFGIDSISPSRMDIVKDPIFSLPIYAPVEKGVLPLAILEETGIPGFTLFAAWLTTLLYCSFQNGPSCFALALCVVLSNLGEAILFSPGGLGLLALLLLMYAVADVKFQSQETSHVDLRRFS